VTLTDPSRNLLVIQDKSGAMAFELGDTRIPVQAGQRILLKAGDSWPYISNLSRYPDRPDLREQLKSLDWTQTEEGGFFISRYRGLIHPPSSGVYRFSIASDDSSRLLLGTDASPESRRVIASVGSYTRPHDWTRTPSQRSGEIHLEQGRSYYLEIVHHQASGPAHLSVAWDGPGLNGAVIDGAYLSPWPEAKQALDGQESPRGTFLRETWKDVPLLSPDEMLAPRALGSILSVRDVQLQVLGPGLLPEPVQAKIGQTLPVEDNFIWSELEGTVMFVGTQGDRLSLELAENGKTVEVVARHWKQAVPSSLRGRRIRVIGVAESVFAPTGERILGRLWLRSNEAVTVTPEAPLAEVARLTSIAELSEIPRENISETAIKLRGRVVSVTGNLVTVSDDGVFHGFVSRDGKEWTPVGTRLENEMPSRVYVGFAVNSLQPNARARAVFSQLEGFPDNLKPVDIGSPALSGKVESSDGKIVIDGVGTDIWDSPDQFTFFQAPLEGPCTLVARIDAFDFADPNAKAGLMIRERLGPDGQFIDLVSTMIGGVSVSSMQWRWGREGSSTSLANDYSRKRGEPFWLKLERRYSRLQVLANEGVLLEPGEVIDVVGYASIKEGKLTIADASLLRPTRNNNSPSEQRDWRPLVDLSLVNDSSRRWGGYDIFRLRGVVTFCGTVSGRRYLVFQDRSAAALMTPRENSDLFSVKAGSMVEIFGNPGWYARSDTLYADNVFVVGPASMPTPIKHPAEYLLPRRGDGTWIELEGIVRSVSPSGLMEVKARGELFKVAISEAQVSSLQRLVDAEVRIRGAITYPSEMERLLLVPALSFLEELIPAPADPFAGTVEELNSFSSESLLNRSKHRVRVSGIVTHAEAGLVHIQDSGAGARVEMESPTKVEIGDAIVATGFPDWEPTLGVVIRHALLRPSEGLPDVIPLPVGAEEAANGLHFMRLVRIQATVAATWGAGEGEALSLEANQKLFRVTFPRTSTPRETLPAGTVVEITGVNTRDLSVVPSSQAPVVASTVLPLRLLTRSAADLVVLSKPSWWVLRRTLLVGALVIFTAGVALVWIQLLRRRVRLRTEELNATMEKLKKETSMSATLAERDRLAGEIHDSLEQGLNGIIYHLECTANHESCSEEVRKALNLACNMASFSRTEVQYAVWELQSPMLEDSDLLTAVEKISQQIAPQSLTATVQVEGNQRRLSSELEHHLLRVVQEALNNIVKHAKASRAEVKLRYGETEIEVAISDDGCGFSPEQVKIGGLGHFGLRSLRSRVAKLGGVLDLNSVPGKGTTIRVTIPISTS